MDLYPIAIMYYLYKPEVLTWPKISDKTSLKLENLNTANKLISGEAHDALVDVEITLELSASLYKTSRNVGLFEHLF